MSGIIKYKGLGCPQSPLLGYRGFENRFILIPYKGRNFGGSELGFAVIHITRYYEFTTFTVRAEAFLTIRQPGFSFDLE